MKKKESARKEVFVSKAIQIMEEGSELPVGSEEALTNAKTASAWMDVAQKAEDIDKGFWQKIDPNTQMKLWGLWTLAIFYDVIEMSRILKKPLSSKLNVLNLLK